MFSTVGLDMAFYGKAKLKSLLTDQLVCIRYTMLYLWEGEKVTVVI